MSLRLIDAEREKERETAINPNFSAFCKDKNRLITWLSVYCFVCGNLKNDKEKTQHQVFSNNIYTDSNRFIVTKIGI